jgi:NAD(P)-dependent dehydrogenase (short-subunit alcohol dehydrogenase family)
MKTTESTAMPLAGRVALVAGATRGAGRGTLDRTRVRGARRGPPSLALDRLVQIPIVLGVASIAA